MNEHYRPATETSLKDTEIGAFEAARQCLADELATPIELEANGIRNALFGTALDPDLLAGRCVGEVAQVVLAVFSQNPDLQNQMRRSLVHELTLLEQGDSSGQQRALLMILKGHYGYGIDDQLLVLLQDQLND